MYCECEGDMGKIIDSVMCATVKDEPRFVKILEDLIKTKEVPKYPAFNRTTSKTQSTSRKRKVIFLAERVKLSQLLERER